MPTQTGFTTKEETSESDEDELLPLVPGSYVQYESLFPRKPIAREPARSPDTQIKPSLSNEGRSSLPPMATELAGIRNELEASYMKKHPGPYYREMDQNGLPTLATMTMTPDGPQVNYVPICTVKKAEDPQGIYTHTLHRTPYGGAEAFLIIPPPVLVEEEEVIHEPVEHHDHSAVPLWDRVGLEGIRWVRDDWTPWLHKEFDYADWDEVGHHHTKAEEQIMDFNNPLRQDPSAEDNLILAKGPSRQARTFLAGSWDDFKAERELIMQDVALFVQDVARMHRYESYIQDMRSQEADPSAEQVVDTRDLRLSLQEAERCAQSSATYSVALLAGHKYGLRPPPLAIPRGVMALLEREMSEEDRGKVARCYALDQNRADTPKDPAKPEGWDWSGGPEYVLHREVPKSQLEEAAGALRQAARVVFAAQQEEVRKPTSTAWLRKFEISTVEDEMARSCLFTDPDKMADRTLVFHRQIEDVEKAIGQPTYGMIKKRTWETRKDVVEDFIDIKDGEVDAEAQDKLSQLLEMLLPKSKRFDQLAYQLKDRMRAPTNGVEPTESSTPSGQVPGTLQWGPFVQLSGIPQHTAYLVEMADVLAHELMAGLEASANRVGLLPDLAVLETAHHMLTAKRRAGRFKPPAAAAGDSAETLRRKTESFEQYRTIQQYLADTPPHLHSHARGAPATSHQRPSAKHALVVHGRAGCGKASLVCRAVMDEIEKREKARGAGRLTVLRFVGASKLSSNVRDLLYSMALQLKRLYKKHDVEVPENWRELKPFFVDAILSWPAAAGARPLTLVLFDVDVVGDTHGGKWLQWLPVKKLPEQLRIIVTTSPTLSAVTPTGVKVHCLDILRREIEQELNFLDAHNMFASADEHALEGMFDQRLAALGRSLQPAQRAEVQRALEERRKSSGKRERGTPLWVDVAAALTARWRSEDGVKHPLDSTVKGLMTDMFGRMAAEHGEHLIKSTVAYLTLAQTGLAELELGHLLSLQDDALADSYQFPRRFVPHVRTIVPATLVRLLDELSPFLEQHRDSSGFELFRWSHREFRAIAREWLFGTDTARSDAELAHLHQRHRELADYFSGKYSESAHKPYEPRLLEVVRLEYPDERSGDRHVLRQPHSLRGRLQENDSKLILNYRRLDELVFHLIEGQEEEVAKGTVKPKRADADVPAAVTELCSMEYIAAKFEAGRSHDLRTELETAMHKFPQQRARLQQINEFVVRNFPELQDPKQRSWRFQLALQEPAEAEVHKSAEHLRSTFHHVEWPFKPSLLGPCLLSNEEQSSRVACVSFCTKTVKGAKKDKGQDTETRRMLVFGSGEGTVMVADDITGAVEGVLLGHRSDVTCVTVSHSGKVALSGSYDKTVRMWDLDNMKEQQVESTEEQSASAPTEGSATTATPPAPANAQPPATQASTPTPQPQRSAPQAPERAPSVPRTSSGGADAGDAGGEGGGVRAMMQKFGGGVGRRMYGKHKKDAERMEEQRKREAEEKRMQEEARRLLEEAEEMERQREAERARILGVKTVPEHPENEEGGQEGEPEKPEGEGQPEPEQTEPGQVEPETPAEGGQPAQAQQSQPTGEPAPQQPEPAQGEAQGEAADAAGATEYESDDEKEWVPEKVVEFAANDIHSLAFSPDEKYAVGGCGDKVVYVWDIVNFETEPKELTGHEGLVMSVAWSHDEEQSMILSGSADCTARVWDAKTFQCLHKLVGHEEWVCSVHFAFDGTVGVTGSWDHFVAFWDLGSHKRESWREMQEQYNADVEARKKRVAEARREYEKEGMRGEFEEEAPVAERLDAPTFAFEAHDEQIRALALSKFSTPPKQLLEPPPPPHEQRQYLLSGSNDQTARLWMLKRVLPPQATDKGGSISAEPVATLTGHSDYVNSVTFSEDGRFCATGSNDQTMKMWDIQDMVQLREYNKFQGHVAPVTAIAFSPDNRFLVSGSGVRNAAELGIEAAAVENSLRVWSTDTMEQQGEPFGGPDSGHQEAVTGVEMAMDASGGWQLVSEDMSGKLTVWDMQRGSELASVLADGQLQPADGTPDSVESLARKKKGQLGYTSEKVAGSAGSNFVVEGVEDMVMVFRRGNQKVAACFYAPDVVNCVAFNGTRIAAGCESGHVLLLSAPTLFEAEAEQQPDT